MKTIQRTIQNQIEKDFFKGKIITIYGARRVGKTTLVKMLQEKFPNSMYLNCDEPDIQEKLTNKTSTELKNLIHGAKVVFIDEAQRVRNIGLTLKLMIDNITETQIVVTGSSCFDLSNKITETLTGRNYEFFLYPFSTNELKQIYESDLEISRLLEQRMIFGFYPEMILQPIDAEKNLKNICKSYLYKDILQFQEIKRPDLLEKLLQALALQIGGEVSFNELANLLGINSRTIMNYISILEQAFIIFSLKPYNKNLRKELGKLRKIYFWDIGVRNAIIRNLNPLDLRSPNEIGQLWENFIISERLKRNNNLNIDKETYFWRIQKPHSQEIDYLEIGNYIDAFECKFTDKKWKASKLFIETYNPRITKLITKENFLEFVG
jgi:uncharacterized protein